MRSLLTTLLLLAFVLSASPLWAQTAEQRKELLELKKEVSRTSTAIRKKEFDEVDEVLKKAGERVAEIAKEAELELNDKKLLGVSDLVDDRLRDLEIARAKEEGREPRLGPSFVEEVAPIIQGKCVNCHGGDNPRKGLDLSTFDGWKKGGQSGRLLKSGKPNDSLLIARLTTPNDKARMPPNGELSKEEITIIGKWIQEGARFDGNDSAVMLDDLKMAGTPEEPEVTVVIPMPKGNETVSFTKDIAPFMANLCVGCHSGNDPDGGLTLTSFHDMMKGGDSGRVVLPGNRDGSRLFRLVGGLENPRMPQGQARITRKNYDDLKKWFDEGNVFDGPDAKAPLASFVQSAEEMAADKLAKLTPEEFNKLRIDRTEEQWKRVAPTDDFRTVKTDDFYIIGNVAANRLEQVDEWAQSQGDKLRKMFNVPEGQIWKGRLAIFVLRDRFNYDEFNQVVNMRRAAKEMTGHSVVTQGYDDAYIVLLDVGDEATDDTAGLQVNLIDHMTGAFLRRDGANMPEWLVRGTGLALAAGAAEDNKHLKTMLLTARDVARTVPKPEDVFSDGTFSPETIGPVGYSLVGYMISNGGVPKFAKFIAELKGGKNTAQAVREVYNADLRALAVAYQAALQNR